MYVLWSQKYILKAHVIYVYEINAYLQYFNFIGLTPFAHGLLKNIFYFIYNYEIYINILNCKSIIRT